LLGDRSGLVSASPNLIFKLPSLIETLEDLPFPALSRTSEFQSLASAPEGPGLIARGGCHPWNAGRAGNSLMGRAHLGVPRNAPGILAESWPGHTEMVPATLDQGGFVTVPVPGVMRPLALDPGPSGA
jgi:hypothetical protein